ncbi:MAG: four helix bundle protein [Desulfuromonadaceae bacterium]
MGSHKDLEVWQRSVDLAVALYRVTAEFPDTEKFGLVSQMRRAAVSIASNIAEGAARQSRKEFIQFLSMAAGSASELHTQMTICLRIDMGNRPDLVALEKELELIAKMVQGLIKSVRART